VKVYAPRTKKQIKYSLTEENYTWGWCVFAALLSMETCYLFWYSFSYILLSESPKFVFFQWSLASHNFQQLSFA